MRVKKSCVPALKAATVNSNITPVNSYVVFQNNTREDFRNNGAVITFENPILGLYYTDGGFDRTIGALGKPGANIAVPRNSPNWGWKMAGILL